MALKRALRIPVKVTTGSAGLVDVKAPPVESDQVHCYQQVAWEISKATSGGKTRARLYIEGRGWKHYLAEQDAPAADTLYTYTKQPYLTARERLCLEIDQAQASTVVKMWLTGYNVESKEEIVT